MKDGEKLREKFTFMTDADVEFLRKTTFKTSISDTKKKIKRVTGWCLK